MASIQWEHPPGVLSPPLLPLDHRIYSLPTAGYSAWLLEQAAGCVAFRFSIVAESAGVHAAPPRNEDAQAVTGCVVMMGSISEFLLPSSKFLSIRHCYLPGAGLVGPGVRSSESTL